VKSRAALDPICAAAVDLAHQAARLEAEGEWVGAHLDVFAEGDRLVTHRFACLLPGYRGWTWCVSVARASRGKQATVNEVVLMPGAEAVTAPAWLPWSDRLRAGDLGAGLVAPTDPEDPRLAPGWSGQEELVGGLDPGPLHPVNWEPGLGRARVPSPDGRRDAAARWYGGEHGPRAATAKAAPGKCASCGWLLLIGGPLGQMFGVCSHLLSPSDGRIVSFDHGCGGHSEVQAAATPIPLVEPFVDDLAASIDFGHS
jgi:hypothetical protein